MEVVAECSAFVILSFQVHVKVVNPLPLFISNQMHALLMPVLPFY